MHELWHFLLLTIVWMLMLC